MRNKAINHTIYHSEKAVLCAIDCTILLHKVMILTLKENLKMLIHHLLLNLKLQQTHYLIPKMLQIFIFHIIVIILDFLTIKDFFLQFFFVLVVHNFVVSFVSAIADIINIVIKHFAVVVPQDNASSNQSINTASNAEHIAAVPNKILTSCIVVNI